MDDDASTPTPAQATPTMPAVAVAAASPRTRTPTPPSLPLERSISQRSVSVASQNIWVKRRAESVRIHNILPSEDSEDDPFASIPDLTVDMTREMENLRLNPSQQTPSGDENESSGDYSRTPSTQRSKSYVTLSPNGAIPEGMSPQAQEELTKLESMVNSPTSDRDDYEEEMRVEDRNRVSPSRKNLTISFSSPIASIIHDVVPEDIDSLEDDTGSISHADGGSWSEQQANNQYRSLTKNARKKLLARSKNGTRRASRNLAVQGQAFTPRPVSRIDEQDEDSQNERAHAESRQISILADASVVSHQDRQTNLSFVVSTPAAHHGAGAIISQNVGNLSLSPLSEFTMNNQDQSFGLEVSYLVQDRHLVTGDGSKKVLSMTVRDLVDRLTEVEPFEANWDDFMELDVSDKRLSSLHMLDEFCGRLVSLDASTNALSHLDGVPSTVRHLKASSNLLTELTSWDHLSNLQKKRQREANKPPRRHSKRASLTEMLTNGRPIISPPMDEPSIAEERPDSPSSTEEPAEDRPRKWQDYLKMATFPTELLSHTPALSASSLEVLESYDQPRSSPGLIADERGFVPAAASTTTSVADLEAVPPETEGGTSVIEDAEPVKLLLQHQNELHDRLQRERTPRWNEFLRKVRVERQREREAATAAANAAAEARYERPSVILPEAALADGELIGITGLGTKGKVGRAKRLEFRNLVFGGIPVAIRPKVWFECSGAAHLRVPGYYQDLVARSDKGLGEDVVREIKADVTRTLTHNTFFRNGAPGVQRLDDILTAYACRNPHIGYCQGMNLITANLLLVTPSAEDAFWILARIVESICPTDYYDKSLLTARADQQVLRQLVTEILPRLSDHLDYLGVDLQIMSFQWFLSVFTDCLSAEALFRVWDVVLCMEEGSLFLFQVAVALLKLNETQILQCDSSTAAYTYLNHQMTNHAISIDNMIKASEALRRYIQKEDVDARRKSAIQAMKIAADEREEANAARRAQWEDAETAAASV
ncbi:hypothetical protein BN1723_013483 [Verticillium longisporum]|uniref:Rab-GAP TBC domain-containing protein n=1 Tax=Verticillium longisporum TaxID=100787 RepID=A0A0G4LSM2_VERLO|nr:hypothetical protein BN1723_013483 [Verticillium longisporum]